jgi:hypothetical protein
VDVSQDWVLACDVQQRFMQRLGMKIIHAPGGGFSTVAHGGRIWRGR